MTHPSRVSGSVSMDGHTSHKLAIAVRWHAGKAVLYRVLCGGRVLPRLEKHSPVVFRPVVHEKFEGFCLGRVAWIGVVQEVEDAVQHLLDGDARPPALALVEDA